MCVVSMIGDHYRNKWYPQGPAPTVPPQPYIWPVTITQSGPTQAEFDKLKKEVMEMKDLLTRAKVYDEITGQKNCEMEDKIAVLRKVADLVGVSLDEIFAK